MSTDDYQTDHVTRQRSPHDECPTCGGCIDTPRVGWSGCWHTPGDDCLLNYCHPCRDECHQSRVDCDGIDCERQGAVVVHRPSCFRWEP